MESESDQGMAKQFVATKVNELRASAKGYAEVESCTDELMISSRPLNELIDELFLLIETTQSGTSAGKDCAFALLVRLGVKYALSLSQLYQLGQVSDSIPSSELSLSSKRMLVACCWRRCHFEIASIVLADLLSSCDINKENYLNALWYAHACVFLLNCELDDSRVNQQVVCNMRRISQVLESNNKRVQSRFFAAYRLLMEEKNPDMAHQFAALVGLHNTGRLDLEQSNLNLLLSYAARSHLLIGQQRESERLLHMARESLPSYGPSSVQTLLIEELRYAMLSGRDTQVQVVDRANEYLHLQSEHPDTLAVYQFCKLMQMAEFPRLGVDLNKIQCSVPDTKRELVLMFFQAVQKKYMTIFEPKWGARVG